MKLNMTVEMPESELEGFLRAVRGWENARPVILMAIKLDVGAMPSSSLVEMFNRLDPPFPFVSTLG